MSDPAPTRTAADSKRPRRKRNKKPATNAGPNDPTDDVTQPSNANATQAPKGVRVCEHLPSLEFLNISELEATARTFGRALEQRNFEISNLTAALKEIQEAKGSKPQKQNKLKSINLHELLPGLEIAQESNHNKQAEISRLEDELQHTNQTIELVTEHIETDQTPAAIIAERVQQIDDLEAENDICKRKIASKTQEILETRTKLQDAVAAGQTQLIQTKIDFENCVATIARKTERIRELQHHNSCLTQVLKESDELILSFPTQEEMDAALSAVNRELLDLSEKYLILDAEHRELVSKRMLEASRTSELARTLERRDRDLAKNFFHVQTLRGRLSDANKKLSKPTGFWS
eukprot:c7957_g1_i1.p1 GENE.c7957_g1_i1~~c7957_g1_i1.p1  ORF type:complete len:348 (+),score=87.02 c7957_g1_i1:44-1087(+)